MKTTLIEFGSAAYDEVLNIRREVFIQEQNISEELEIDEFENSALYFLTTVDGVPAGTGRLRVVKDKIKFERIATLKRFRGKGIASHLMKTMLQYAQAHYSHLNPYMHSQQAAVSFYEKLGWKKTGDPFIEADIPHQAMMFINISHPRT